MLKEPFVKTNDIEMLSEKGLAAAKAEFELELEGELTSSYTERYLGQLYTAIGNAKTPSEFISSGEQLHFQIAHDVYGPLVLGCVQFMADYFVEAGIQGNIYFALRDAAPLMKVSEHVMIQKGLNAVGIFINRPLCGIGDEINPEGVPNGDMSAIIQKYLKQAGALDQEKVGWVDAGCWGTVPLVLKTHHFASQEYYPVFFYSHNPKIPDYLHWLASGTGVSEEALNCMNDSLECLFPSPVRRPLLLVEQNGNVEPKLKESSVLSQKWGKAALAGVEQYAKEKSASGVSHGEQQLSLGVFIEKTEQSKQGIWSGTLWQSTPIWSQGTDFLSKYPKGLYGK